MRNEGDDLHDSYAQMLERCTLRERLRLAWRLVVDKKLKVWAAVLIASMISGCAAPSQWVDVEESSTCFKEDKGVMTYGVQEKGEEKEVALQK